jgi:hypothetical protein
MAGRVHDYERTMAFADIALGQMKALRQPASPRNFEIWYAYTSGYHPASRHSTEHDVAGGHNGCRAHSPGGNGQRIDETLDR